MRLAWATALALSLAMTPALASAQDDQYAWGGEEGGSTGETASTDDPIRIMGFLGGGIGFRLLRNLDSPFLQDFVAPAYLDVGGALYLPGRELRFGPGLTVSTNLSEGAGNQGLAVASQWVITPSFNILLPLWRLMDGTDYDEVQIQIRAGIPLVIGQGLGDPNRVDFTFGGELGLAVHYKFLAGFGIYAEAQLVVVGGLRDTVHPLVTLDAGFMIDYEVLP